MVAEKHGGGCFAVAVLGKEGDKTKLRQEAGLGKARAGTVLRTSQKMKGLPWE